MTYVHVILYDGEYDALHHHEERDAVGEHGDVEGDGAPVEGEHVGPLQERECALEVATAYVIGDVFSVTLSKMLHKLLQIRRFSLLTEGVVQVEHLQRFLHGMLPEGYAAPHLKLLGEAVLMLSVLHVKIGIAYVVGHARLVGVEHETLETEDEKSPDAPLGPQTHHQTDVDAEIPYILRRTVEDASEAARLARHACQLTVGAVEEVGPHEQRDTEHVPQETVPPGKAVGGREETESGGNAEQYGEIGDGVGVHTETVEQARPHQSYGTGEIDVDILLRIFTFGV